MAEHSTDTLTLRRKYFKIIIDFSLNLLQFCYTTRYGFSDSLELHCNDNKPPLSLRVLKSLLGLEM